MPLFTNCLKDVLLDTRAGEHPIAIGDILLRKVGERYELGVNFWPKAD